MPQSRWEVLDLNPKHRTSKSKHNSSPAKTPIHSSKNTALPEKERKRHTRIENKEPPAPIPQKPTTHIHKKKRARSVLTVPSIDPPFTHQSDPKPLDKLHTSADVAAPDYLRCFDADTDDCSPATPPPVFRRIESSTVTFTDDRLKNNAFDSKGEPNDSFGHAANRLLEHKSGKQFRSAKSKRKQAPSFGSGKILTGVYSVKLD